VVTYINAILGSKLLVCLFCVSLAQCLRVRVCVLVACVFVSKCFDSINSHPVISSSSSGGVLLVI
jgi:hypothetical protein